MVARFIFFVERNELCNCRLFFPLRRGGGGGSSKSVVCVPKYCTLMIMLVNEEALSTASIYECVLPFAHLTFSCIP